MWTTTPTCSVPPSPGHDAALAVLRATATMPHATADDIVTALAAELPTTSHQAVYGVLGALTGVGLVRRIEPAGSPARYERRTGDNHHHVVCTLAVRSMTSTAPWATRPA